jgi:GntR family transcriptional regulator
MDIIKQPIYQQLNQLLKEKIEQEEYHIGDKFPTERAICEQYEVSRATANKAISNLVSEGILEFRKGIGTFVKSPPRGKPTEAIASFTENVRKAGRLPSTTVLHFERLAASQAEDGVAELLKIALSEELYRVERLRMADDIPLILENRYLVAKYCPNLSEEALRGSLYALFLNAYKLTIIGTDETIQAITIRERESKLLAIDQGLAAFRVTSVGYIEGDIPLWWEQTIHRPDGIEFRCRVRAHRPERNFHERLLLSSPSVHSDTTKRL